MQINKEAVKHANRKNYPRANQKRFHNKQEQEQYIIER